MAGGKKFSTSRWYLLAAVAALTCVGVTFVLWRMLPQANSYQNLLATQGNAPSTTIDAATVFRIEAFCSDCHAMPRAESFPRDAWYDEVEQGYQIYAKSGRKDLDPPPMGSTVTYFRSRAPERMVLPEPKDAATQLPVTFSTEQRTLAQNGDIPPAVSHLRWTRLGASDDPILLASDMRHGHILAVDLQKRQVPPRLLARLHNPCHIEPCDLDGDGAIDLVLADLGSFAPGDHDRGRVVWLRRLEGEYSFEEIVLASGLGRVADVRPADLDGDGDLDLIVAEFGHYRTGKIAILRNVASDGERPRFELQELDPRPGTIHVPPHDFNDDGLPDFVALVSQEHETVEAFVNQGDARFHSHTVWAAPDLTFGSTGIELVDLDQDGGMDILYSNGDAFDNSFLNPSHGIQWLENLGNFKFDYHRLTDMSGAYSASAGDVDLDGDLDIIAVALLPSRPFPTDVATNETSSILCLEQTQPGIFLRHTLELGSPCHATLEMADFDDDGDLDFVTGSWVMPKGAKNAWALPCLTVWWNQGIAKHE